MEYIAKSRCTLCKLVEKNNCGYCNMYQVRLPKVSRYIEKTTETASTMDRSATVNHNHL